MPHKDNCGFRKLNCCSFKEEYCLPDKCDMYDLEFSSKAIKDRMEQIKAQVLLLQKDTLNMALVKDMLKKESTNKTHPQVLEYKRKLMEMKDLGEGYKYLQKAYIHCKRIRR